MLYVIYAEDVLHSLEKRIAARPAHVARLERLRDENRLIVAGPCPIDDHSTSSAAGFSGSVIIAEFSSLVDAQAFADSDPYVTAGVYQHVRVKPFKKVLP